MYGLTRDFIRNGGAFMVLEKAEGLRMEELSRVQMGMLSSNQIPRLLPVHIREVDRNVTLQYDISGYKMLSQMLKSSKIKLRVLYGLLFQLADAFTECRQYMLEPRKLLIQEEYLFINGSFEQGELGMVYVPIMDTVEVDPTPQQFRELVIRLMAQVQELQGKAFSVFCSYVTMNAGISDSCESFCWNYMLTSKRMEEAQHFSRPELRKPSIIQKVIFICRFLSGIAD